MCVALTPLQRVTEADALHYNHVSVQIDRAKRTATWTVKAPGAPQPEDIAGIEAAGAAWYPLAMARELEDAILQMRTNELDIGVWLLKTEGDAAAVLAVDATLIAHQAHWLVRETIGLLSHTTLERRTALATLLRANEALRRGNILLQKLCHSDKHFTQNSSAE